MSLEDENPSTRLLDDDGEITEQLEKCLKHIFAKYCTPSPEDKSAQELCTPPEGAHLSDDGLDAWARDTNGAPFSEEQKEELQMLDIDEGGHLTFQGFLQIYQLQAGNDEEETWRDLAVHGFNRKLQLITDCQKDTKRDGCDEPKDPTA